MKISNVGIFANLKNGPKEFIENALTQLTVEFNLWGSIDTDIFEYNERAFLGFFINAIIRKSKDRYSALQEYVVYKQGKSVGRADLLVYDNDTPCFYLFEAKRFKYFDARNLTDWINENAEKTLLKEAIDKQTRFYFEAEKHFFENKLTYLCAIYFEIIKNMENIDKLSPTRLDENLKDIFYTVYHFNDSTNNGLAVYGLIKED
jgi:hypothetical protein